MSEFQPLIDQLYREEVEEARKMTPAQRMRAVLDLSSMWYSKESDELRRRIRIVEEMEERGCYGPPQPRL